MKSSRLWRSRDAAVGLLSLGALLLSWECLSYFGLLNPFFFPAPSALAGALRDLAVTGFPDGFRIHQHIVVSLARILAGFLGAAAVGIPIGIVVGYIPALDKATRGIFAFGRSTAAISLLPLFIVWFGIGEVAKIALIGLGAFWVIVTYTVSAVKFVDPLLIRAARAMDTPPATIFRRVILPAALPRIFVGLKVAISVAFMIIVAAEMIATVHGLGALIQEARTSFRTDITIVGMLIIGGLGFVISRALDQLEAYLLPWRTAAQS